ncbi:hypothetical protein FHW67_004267 [Herbaspirillum sp. Sphag1AN]|nr:hypothetical protein [Herbaspirillum sp. Sphag1AN]MBB3248132.1 hypothetical protein [Herbaspirillum sp. Sphag64]
MNQRKKFELIRWLYFVLLFFLCSTVIVILSELVIGPAFQWLLNDTPYQLPTLNRVSRMTLVILLISFSAGTISWYHEKRISGR